MSIKPGELHCFVSLAVSFGGALEIVEALLSSRQVSFCIDSVSECLRQSVIGNVGTVACFRIGAEDAPLISRELGIESAKAVTGLGNFTAFIKTMYRNEPTDSRIVFVEQPAFPDRDAFNRVRNRSRATYARRSVEVEDQINRFFSLQ